MLIVCKTCASSYHIPREILGENGARLRCVGCGETWAVKPGVGANDDAPIVEGERGPGPPPQIAWNGTADRLVAHSGGVEAAWRADEEGTAPPGAARGGWRGVRPILAALAILGVGMAVAAERQAIVKAAPHTARLFAAVGLPVNLRGLALDNLHTSIFDLGDRRVLVVEGAIVNLRDSTTEAPNIRIALRGRDKRELYVWTTPAPKNRLGPDEQVAFRTRLAAPPDAASDVLVRFASAGDRPSALEDAR